MSKERDFFTVEFQITDRDTFMNIAREITGHMAGETLFYGGKVIACGQGQAMTEVDYMREFLMAQGHDPEEIIRVARIEEKQRMKEMEYELNKPI